MMNQDQYHASLLNKGQPIGLGWDGITKASKQKIYPMEPPNMTDPDETIKKVQDDDPKYIDLNWNNIKVDERETFRFRFVTRHFAEHIGREVRKSVRGPRE
jgi:tropomodulin